MDALSHDIPAETTAGAADKNVNIIPGFLPFLLSMSEPKKKEPPDFTDKNTVCPTN
jgi:hypothetical protein